jgi:hypothetical protein
MVHMPGGDYDSESGIDILLLVDIEKLEIKKYHRQLVKITSDLELEYVLLKRSDICPF